MPDPEQSTQRGFAMSRKRITAELTLIGAALILVVLVVIWLARAVSGHLVSWMPTSVDQRLGEQSWAIVRAGAACDDPDSAQYVEQLVARLTHGLPDSPFRYQVALLDTDEVNAFALPGGFIAVHRGLLETASSSEEVAGVLAHELMHVEQRHGARRVLRELGTATLLSAIVGGSDLAVPAAVATDLIGMRYDREQEQEADRLGAQLMSSAGLSPTALASFFDRLSEQGDGQLPGWLATHPDPGDRARALASGAPAPRGARTDLPPLPAPRCR